MNKAYESQNGKFKETWFRGHEKLPSKDPTQDFAPKILTLVFS